MAIPVLDAHAVAQHILGLPAEADPTTLEILARSRFVRARWEPLKLPTASSGGRHGAQPEGDDDHGAGPAPTRALRLSRHSRAIGPYAVDRGVATETGLPLGVAYLIDAPAERGAKPTPLGGDRSGFRRAFPDGMPVRDEARVLAWALDVARRLGGSLRIAGPDGPGVLLTPEPAAAVDLTVWSDLWLHPDALLEVMRTAAPRAYLNLPSGRWYGPPPGTGERAVPGTEVLTPAQRGALHSAADEFDRAALEDPVPMISYGALVDLELDGMIALEVSGETTLPPVVAGLPWASEGAVAYRVRWEPVDLRDAESEHPSPSHRVARGRATPLVSAIARVVHSAVGGEVTDTMDFVVDPADL
jgi:hypothetical protein